MTNPWLVLAPCLAIATAACGDNTIPIGPPLAPATTMFITAHQDDEMLFMQPMLVDAIARGSLTTVYVATGDPSHGDDHAEQVFDDARVTYGAMAGGGDWQCGYLEIAGAPVRHCRLADRGISLIALDVPDGGIDATVNASLLQLVSGEVPSLALGGAVGGDATVESITQTLAALIEATAPQDVHTLDLAADHGRDHSNHLFTASFALWALGRTGYTGPIHWHRGYSVDPEPISISDADYAAALPMVETFDGCYDDLCPCGSICDRADPQHLDWLQRQYWTDRVATAAGHLRSSDTGSCVVVTGTAIALGDCASAAAVTLADDGSLRIGQACASSTASGAIALATCATGDPAQYWVLDGDGLLWNARIPGPTTGMGYDHVRCLAIDLFTPTCGEHRQPRWQLVAS